MSASICRPLCVGLCLSLVVVFLAAGSPDAQVKPSAEPAKPKAIPLNTAYCWTKQEGLKTIDEVKYDTNELHKLFTEHGLSNIVFVRGRDIKEALSSTQFTFFAGTGDRNGVRVAPEDMNPAKSLWVVAFVGNGSSTPPVIEFTGAERDGNRFRVSYRPTRPNAGACDHVPYPLWVPVGELAAGKYTLELYDADAKEVVLTRLVRHTK